MESGAKDPGGNGAVPEAEGRDGAARRLRPEMEALRERRARRMRWTRRVLLALVGLGVLILVGLIADWQLLHAFRARYDGQAWIEIYKVYDDLEKGMVLEVHRERAMKDLEARYLGCEAVVFGRLTAAGPAEGGGWEVIVDVPHFEEVVNFYDDDVHVELPAASEPPLEPGGWVKARGTVTSFSKYRLRMKGTSVRPLSSLEKFYLHRILPPTKLTREPIGFNRLLK